jgi:hypothetical protein
MSESIERIENMIRVVSEIADDRFDIKRWFDYRSGCGCAIGHAMQDAYFVARRFTPPLGRRDVYEFVADYFGISETRATQLFVIGIGYETRLDVLAGLRVLLLEKIAQELPAMLGPVWAVELELT